MRIRGGDGGGGGGGGGRWTGCFVGIMAPK